MGVIVKETGPQAELNTPQSAAPQTPFRRFLKKLHDLVYEEGESAQTCHRCGVCRHMCSLWKADSEK
jgi:hypothetical protein